MDLLRFDEKYFEVVWGGHKLRTQFGKPAPEHAAVGEAWLVSDHAQCESVVAEGPFAGRSLRELMQSQAAQLLGARPKPTAQGRFPLLLKLIDAEQYLSIQVHPDDVEARRLGEADCGKTEMWYVLEAAPGAELICGLKPEIGQEAFETAMHAGTVRECVLRERVRPGDAVFVPAGMIHAIAPGLVLAEIQQNSAITYRVDDWGRVGRELHKEKALRATKFGLPFQGLVRPQSCGDGAREMLASCEYFAAELVRVAGGFHRDNQEESFHLLLGVEGDLRIGAGASEARVARGEAILVAGSLPCYEVTGNGEFLDYYVPGTGNEI